MKREDPAPRRKIDERRDWLPRQRLIKKQKAEAFGRKAEALGAWYLRLKGYRILHRRYRTIVGEIDFIAQQGHTLVFVEVKARLDKESFREALTMRQKKRIEKAAVYYISKQRKRRTLEVRFDILWLRPWRWPQHIKNAWYKEGHSPV